MTISPQLQTLLYGTGVVVGVAITGVLWYGRSTPGNAKMVDYIEIYQSCLEKCLATEYWTGAPSNHPPAPTVYTNRAIDWIPDPSGRGYHIYPTNGATWQTNSFGMPVLVSPTNNAIWTNYMIKAGETNNIWTNHLNRTYKTYLLNPRRHDIFEGFDSTLADELTGTDGRYIWNAYTNITISGLSIAAANGIYTYITNGRFARPSVPVYPSWQYVLDLRWPFLGSPDYIYVYSNDASPTHYLFDRGPRDAIGKSPAFATFMEMSTVIVRSTFPFPIQFATSHGDSPFNGPWFRQAPSFLIQTTTVTSAGFNSNFLRDASCRWYIDKHVHDAFTLDSRYIRTMLNAIAPELKSYQFDVIEDKMSYGNPPPGPPPYSLTQTKAFVDHHSASGETFLNMTNEQDWVNLSLTWTGICAHAGISQVYTNHQPPTTGDVDRLSRALKEFKWTRLDGASNPWFAPGELSGAPSMINFYGGVGISQVSWAMAKVDALANLGSNVLTATRPFSYTSGDYYEGSITSWTATIMFSQEALSYPGANTAIVHTADFYVRAARLVPSSTNSVFDPVGTTLVEGYYEKTDSVGPGTNAFPYTVVGTGAYPTWCEDPIIDRHAIGFLYVGYTSRGYVVDGEEIVLKWDWNYNP